MKDATYWKNYREKRKKDRETEFKPATSATVKLQPEPKTTTESVTSPPAGTVAQIVATTKRNPDDFKGLHDPEYYKTCCVFCGSPDTKFMTRNSFAGYLCHTHAF